MAPISKQQNFERGNYQPNLSRGESVDWIIKINKFWQTSCCYQFVVRYSSETSNSIDSLITASCKSESIERRLSSTWSFNWNWLKKISVWIQTETVDILTRIALLQLWIIRLDYLDQSTYEIQLKLLLENHIISIWNINWTLADIPDDSPPIVTRVGSPPARKSQWKKLKEKWKFTKCSNIWLHPFHS